MKYTMTTNGNELTAAVSGRLDTLTAPELEKGIQPALNEAQTLILDLGELEYISSAGLRVILSLRHSMDTKGGLTLKNVSESIMEIFEVTGLTSILNIE